MAIDMKRRKRIISLSRGATSIKQFRESKEEVKHRGKERETFREKAIAKGEIPTDWAKAKKTPEKVREPAPGFTPVEQVAQAPTQPTGQLPTQEPSPLAAPPTVAPGALAEGMVTPGLVAEQQQFQETPTPEGFARDVAQATALGLSAIALGISLAPGAVALAGSGGLTSPTIARIASGRIIKETGKVVLGKAARNTKNAKRTMSLLSRLVKTPLGLGIMGTYAFSVHLSLNDRSDAIMSLGIALNDAKRSGDLERAKELMVIIEDVNSAGTIIEAFYPIINYPLAAIRKAELTMIAGSSMIKQMEDTNYTLTPYEAAKRKEADEYWANIREQNK